jgi:hypothetical protein
LVHMVWGENRSKNDCTSFLHHNRSQRDKYNNAHAFQKHQWQGGQCILLPGRVLGML